MVDSESRTGKHKGLSAMRYWVVFSTLIVLLGLCGCGDNSQPYEGKSVEELRSMLDDEDPRVQMIGALGLSRHGQAATPALPRLIELLSSPDALVRQNAALALGKIGSPAKVAVPKLHELLSDPDWSIRRQAVLSLGEIGEPSKRTTDLLRRIAKNDPDSLVRKTASKVLTQIHTEREKSK